MNDSNAEPELDSILDSLDAPTPEEQAPAEAFPRGGVAQGLERLRAKLLDLTNRNRLLNYRHPRASSLRVVNVGLQSVFTRITNGSKLVFDPVPEPPPREIERLVPDGENASTLAKPSAQEHAESLGWNTAFDLEPGLDPDDSTTLPVLHYLESLESVTRKIGTAAKTSIEESGTNMLFLIFGFLEWYEDDNSQLPRLAPLLTVPVTLERSVGRGGTFESSIELQGDDPINNISLAELMKKDFLIEIPAIEETDSPDEYFQRFAEILRQKPRWRIRRQITLTLLSFGKLLMYRDLDPEIHPTICTHPLVRDLFEGVQAEELTRAEEFDIDDPHLQDRISLILDADSSQHSALIDALRGRNLVIEGPPGTGKSQTITNLIAAALSNGKTVLFVAEKLAALEVVRRRLDDAGLGMFCLELHSHKTKKQALISDLEDRLNAKGSFREPHDLANQAAIYESKKRQLVKYVETINSELPSHESTVFDTLWARERCFLDLPLAENIRGSISNIGDYDRLRYLEKRHTLSVYAAHLTSVLQSYPALEDHPWRWITKPLGFEDTDIIFETIEELMNSIGALRGQVEELGALCGLPCEFALKDIDKTTNFTQVLPEVPQNLNGQLVDCCRERDDREALRQLVADMSAVADTRAQIAYVVGENREPPTISELASIQAMYDALSALGMTDTNLARLKKILVDGIELEKGLGETDNSFDYFQSLVECEIERNSQGIELLLAFTQLLSEAPFDALHLRLESLEADGACAIVRSAAEEGGALRKLRDGLDFDVNVALALERYSAHDLDGHAERIEDAGFLARLLGTEYRKAKACYKRVARSRKKHGRGEMARSLRQLGEFSRKHSAFDSRPAYAHALGVHLSGIDSDWAALSTLVGWYEQVFTLLPEHLKDAIPLRQLLLRGRAERLKSLNRVVISEAIHVDRLNLVRRLLPSIITTIGNVPNSTTIADLFDAIKIRNATISSITAGLEEAGIDQATPFDKLPIFISSGHAYLKARDRVTTNQRALAILGERFSGARTDFTTIATALAFSESIVAARLPDAVAAWILVPQFDTHLDILRHKLEDLAEQRTHLAELCKALDIQAGSSFCETISDSPLSQVEETLALALKAKERMEEWTQFLRAKEQANKESLGKIAALAETKKIAPDHLVPAFDYLFYNSLSQNILDKYPILSEFSGKTQDQIRRQFADADKESIRLNRQAIAAKVDQRPVPNGMRGAQVKSLTELSLINHVLHHPLSRIKIRQLIGRAGKALQSLKPCFMMGPLSVAQYLPPGNLKFDLIVMDEASQLRPEDAVGVIARGKQVVIVGDPMQLPPTNFFQRVTQSSNVDTSDDEQTVVDEGESILDVASTVYQPLRRLRWHYRSRHHSLIAVSNSLFYKDLIIFPSAYHEKEGLGVKYHSVPAGVCENSRNPREAETIVTAILEHMKDHPDQSLGVVALNLEQCELIEELLEKRLRTDPFAAAYQEQMNSGSEPFFVKNLENVQGDERDVIFISATYGPDSKGNFYQRFGPINGPNGHRRLNVLFTRAKMRVEVFSSFDPDRIRADSQSRLGVHALKTYLNYAKTGILSAPDEQQNDQPVNDFENSVGRILTEEGYSVVPQVGVAGFFIDLAVKHPTMPGKFLIGIECDGKAYHSGRSARDRDRLRQEILENLGWKIHRVWSTDWFKNRATEKARLLGQIKALLAADPSYRTTMTDLDRAKGLRQRLIKLRDTEIAKSFPDTPHGAELLRDDMLDRFVAKKPKSRNDWFRLFPEEIRTSIDSRQVSRYIDTVMGLIKEFNPH